MEQLTDRTVRLLHRATTIIEVLVAVALVALAVGALVALASDIFHMAGTGIKLTPGEFNVVIGTVLEVFILIELFRIAVAYMRRAHVVPTVLEAALVAVARKFIVFEGDAQYLATAAGLSALLLAVAASWWMIAHSGQLENERD